MLVMTKTPANIVEEHYSDDDRKSKDLRSIDCRNERHSGREELHGDREQDL